MICPKQNANRTVNRGRLWNLLFPARKLGMCDVVLLCLTRWWCLAPVINIFIWFCNALSLLILSIFTHLICPSEWLIPIEIKMATYLASMSPNCRTCSNISATVNCSWSHASLRLAPLNLFTKASGSWSWSCFSKGWAALSPTHWLFTWTPLPPNLLEHFGSVSEAEVMGSNPRYTGNYIKRTEHSKTRHFADRQTALFFHFFEMVDMENL